MMSMEGFYGLGIGYSYAQARKQEQEVKQGKNDYQASLYQIQELSSLSSLASLILSLIPDPSLRMGATIGNTVLPFASLLLMPTSAAIKNGNYEQGVQFFGLTGILPEKIEESTVKFFTFIADHSSSMTAVGLATGMVALPFFGFSHFAVGMGVPIAYHALESINAVPSCINSFVEKYMHTFVNASMLLSGGPFAKGLALLTLSSGLPGASDAVQKKFERAFLSQKGASLHEVDMPWSERNDLTFNEILFILDNDSRDLYEINVAHCSKQADFGVDLPKDDAFKDFLKIFEKIKWSYAVLKPKFKDDDRFIDLLKEKYGKEDFDTSLEQWAQETTLSKEEILAEQLHEQINDFVSILCKEKAVKGFAYDLEDAIESCSTILAYIKSLPENAIEAEDILLKLAVEGGDYCARGIKRTSAEIASGIITQGISDDPQKIYELKIRKQLQSMRQNIMQNFYQKMIEIMVIRAKTGENTFISSYQTTTDVQAVAIAQDVHIMDIYRKYLALGFYPMTENERYQFGMVDLFTWSHYKPIRQRLYELYYMDLDQAVKEHGEIHFFPYIMQKINTLDLSQEQKDLLIDRLGECAEGEKTVKSFRRLFFIMQGIINLKSVYDNWFELDPEWLVSDEQFEKELSEWEVTTS